MQEPRVTKEQAIKLKAAGFDYETDEYCYTEDGKICTGSSHIWNQFDWAISRPTLSDAIRWLREVKGWHVYAEPVWDGQKYWIGNVVGLPVFSLFQTDNHPTHDLAISAGIDEVLSRLEKEVGNG